LVLAGPIYHELTWRDLWEVARRTSAMVAAIMFLIGATNIVGDLVTRERIDESISSFFLGFTANPMLILLMVNIMLLLLGIPLEPIPLMLIFIPMLAPFMAKVGVDPIHFGVVMVLNLMLGLITPPVGMVMFLMMSMARCSMWEFTKEILPFFVALLAVLLLITYVPSIVLWLPDLLLGARRV
jgi:tripartite ATP-independent transporter DctM subunit